MKQITLITLVIIIAILGIAGFIFSNKQQQTVVSEELMSMPVMVYRDPNCGCCGAYANYLRNYGLAVTVEDTEDMGAIKEEYNVPRDLQSCHTAIIGDRVIEGYVSIAAVEAMFERDVSAIALPGMPVGSPGMSGVQRETLAVYSFGGEIAPTLLGKF